MTDKRMASVERNPLGLFPAFGELESVRTLPVFLSMRMKCLSSHDNASFESLGQWKHSRQRRLNAV
jgi:hypothetical protein